MTCPAQGHSTNTRLTWFASGLSALEPGPFQTPHSTAPFLFHYFLFSPSKMGKKTPNYGKTLTMNAFALGKGMAGCRHACTILQTACYLEERSRNGSFCALMPAGSAWAHKHSMNNKCHTMQHSGKLCLGWGVWAGSWQWPEVGSAVAILVPLRPFPLGLTPLSRRPREFLL